jgi:CHAD domain-containing protein/adenylate cyclase class IV
VEIEAKYSVADPAVFAALLEVRALGEYALRPTGSRDVIDHYLDTPARDILRGGYACRLREGEKDGRWLVTVKGLDKAAGAVHQREEHECEIPPSAPPDEWPEGPAREIVTRLSGGEALVELFTLRQHRDLRAVEQDGRAVAELSLDTVEMHIGPRTSVTHEVEIELEAAGTLDDLHAIAAALEPYKLKAQSKSKFERALAKLGHARAGSAGKKKAPGTRPDEPLAEAGRKILRFHYERMVANEDGTREGKDIEALHHMRVATRRQRAAFRIVAPYFRRKAIRAFRDELRTAAGYLGAVRDLDVLIEAAERHRSTLSSAAAEGLGPLLDEWRGKRDAAREDLLAYLNGGDYQAFKESYDTFLSSTGDGLKDVAPDDAPEPHLVRHILPAGMWDHYGRVRAYETVLSWASVETIHALRIECKRLRYVLEFFSEALGRGTSEAIEALVALQDHTGELHDADVTIGLLRHFLIHNPQASVDPAVASSVKEYLKLEQARLRTLQRTLKRPWRRVAGKRFRGLLARAAEAL